MTLRCVLYGFSGQLRVQHRTDHMDAPTLALSFKYRAPEKTEQAAQTHRRTADIAHSVLQTPGLDENLPQILRIVIALKQSSATIINPAMDRIAALEQLP